MYPHIALIGLARSGKDTVAKIMAEEASFRRLAFADALKAAALRTNPVIAPHYDNPSRALRLADVVEQYGWEEAKSWDEVRAYLQAFGQALRALDDRVWIRPVIQQLWAATAAEVPCAVTDVRYLNEARTLKDLGATVIRVHRPGAGLNGAAGSHSSETELADYEPDHTLYNDGDLIDLRFQVTHMLDCLR